MMSRWGHGHSFGTGVLVGLMVSRRPELIFAAGVAVGVTAMYARRVFGALERFLLVRAARRS